MPIGKEEICSLIPHAGSMFLLESVLDWDSTGIRCSATSHTDIGNPLRNGDRLASVHLLEYGAQAMAVHGGLLARASGTTVAPGYLAALHDVILHRDYIENAGSPLIIDARMMASQDSSFIYNFSIGTGNTPLASARATVCVRGKTRP